MNNVDTLSTAPRVVERACGGFQALSNDLMPICIGAIGETPEEAVRKYTAIVNGWLRDRAVELAASSTH
jgi:hypothetical protein